MSAQSQGMIRSACVNRQPSNALLPENSSSGVQAFAESWGSTRPMLSGLREPVETSSLHSGDRASVSTPRVVACPSVWHDDSGLRRFLAQSPKRPSSAPRAGRTPPAAVHGHRGSGLRASRSLLSGHHAPPGSSPGRGTGAGPLGDRGQRTPPSEAALHRPLTRQGDPSRHWLERYLYRSPSVACSCSPQPRRCPVSTSSGQPQACGLNCASSFSPRTSRRYPRGGPSPSRGRSSSRTSADELGMSTGRELRAGDR